MFNVKRLKIEKVIRLILCSMMVFALPGCSTVFGSNDRMIKVDSKPEGATVFMDGQKCGVTPAIVTLPQYIYGGKNITLKKEGYADQTVKINSKFQMTSMGNFLGVIPIYYLIPTIPNAATLAAVVIAAAAPGFIVDAATGNLVKIDPATSSIYAEMQKIPTKSSE